MTSLLLLIASLVVGLWLLDNFYFPYFVEYWEKSFDFRGRTNRKIFWISQIQVLITSFFFFCLSFTIFWDIKRIHPEDFTSDIDPFFLIPIYIYGILTSIPNLSIQIRRLRDVAKNPFWIFINFLPIIGPIILLIFYISPSKTTKNINRLQKRISRKLEDLGELFETGIIDEEEYTYLRKDILRKNIN